jgi:three-Cys-motif partner protein
LISAKRYVPYPFSGGIMAQKPFGGEGTLTKLSTIEDYLEFYTRALSKQEFRLHYLDAFAGTGEIPLRDEMPLLQDAAESDTIIEGSARRALKIKRPFDRYVFVDRSPGKVKSLHALKDKFPKLRDRIHVYQADANDAVRSFCEELGARDRSVIFLDPFGNQVAWETIEAIAATQKADLWYLFPAGLGVMRQITRDGKIIRDAEASLNRIFGDFPWRDHVIAKRSGSPEMSDLFEKPDEDNYERIATTESVTRLMISRMQAIFPGGVSDKWLALGKGRRHEYSLLFAWANPSEGTRRLAGRVSADIMRRK